MVRKPKRPAKGAATPKKAIPNNPQKRSKVPVDHSDDPSKAPRAASAEDAATLDDLGEPVENEDPRDVEPIKTASEALEVIESAYDAAGLIAAELESLDRQIVIFFTSSESGQIKLSKKPLFREINVSFEKVFRFIAHKGKEVDCLFLRLAPLIEFTMSEIKPFTAGDRKCRLLKVYLERCVGRTELVLNELGMIYAAKNAAQTRPVSPVFRRLINEKEKKLDSLLEISRRIDYEKSRLLQNVAGYFSLKSALLPFSAECPPKKTRKQRATKKTSQEEMAIKKKWDSGFYKSTFELDRELGKPEGDTKRLLDNLRKRQYRKRLKDKREP
jgi:hypothetical protein